MSEITQKQIFKEIRNFLIIAIAVSIGSFGWCAFVLTHKVPIGGILVFRLCFIGVLVFLYRLLTSF